MKPLVVSLLCGSVLLAGACGKAAPAAKYAQKLVILGFDGMDPDLVRQWMQEGKLPNMAKLAEQGGFYDLQTTHSPESPTAWATFATGANAGKHNIYDFLVRNTATYSPDLGMVRRVPPRFLLDYVPVSRPQVLSTRGGTSFWVTAGQAGVRSSILTVPVTFPPEEVANGEMLSGLPLPDIRGTMGTFSYFATDLSRYEEGDTEMGGILKRLVFDGDTAQTELVGPPNPIVKQQMQEVRQGGPLDDQARARLAELEATADVRVPFTVTWNRAAKSASVSMEGQTATLGEGEWSQWIMLDFRVNLLVRLHGMVQLYLISAGDDLRLYVSPVNWHPSSPPVPMSYPASMSGELFDRFGPFRTLGWAEATWPLDEDRVDEKMFMEDLRKAFDDRARVILNRAESSSHWDLLVGVIETTDRVQHMMWRLIDPKHPMYDPQLAAKYGDSIEKVYRWCDELVGQVIERIPANTPVMVVSDHGFNTWRKAVNLNAWLVDEGYMVLKGHESKDKTLGDLFGGSGQFFEDVDWSRTRAYALGIGQVYFNVRGRESKGIVSPGAEYKALADELSAKFLTLRDPEDGTQIVRAAFKRDDIYSGPFLADAPDLQLGMEAGYRVSWQTTLGVPTEGIVYTNQRRWGADHGGFDYRITAGTLISSRAISTNEAKLMDIAPTVLKYFGVPIPAEIDGKPLF